VNHYFYIKIYNLFDSDDIFMELASQQENYDEQREPRERFSRDFPFIVRKYLHKPEGIRNKPHSRF
jgi:hypothetical protein